jgi:hypothetical protein
MADPQDPTNSAPDGAGTPPEKKPPAKAAKKTAKAPAKKAPAKKAPAKKAPAKKVPAKNAEPASPKPPEQPVDLQQRAESNGDLTAAAKDAAAQAKSTVEAANNPVPPAVAGQAVGQSPVPLIVALAVSLLAILLIRQLRRR